MDAFLHAGFVGIERVGRTLRVASDSASRSQLGVVVGAIPVAHPLPDVPADVVEPVAVRRKLRDRRDAGERSPQRCRDRESGLDGCWPSTRPPFLNSSPHGKSCPVRPPRAANSHSASVGRRLPAHCAYASASAYAMCTTGKRSLPAIELFGPSGWRQLAPLISDHH